MKPLWLFAAAIPIALTTGCRPQRPPDAATEREAAFLQAVLKNDGAGVERILREGFPVNKPLTVQSPQGGLRHPTAVMLAAMTGQPGMLQRLAAAGADLKAKDEKGRTALLWAQFGKDQGQILGIAKLLADAGLDVDASANDGFTPLMFAVGSGHADLVGFLLSRGADPNHQASDGTSALFLSIRAGDPQIIRALVEKKADVNLRSVDGNTPLLALTAAETLSARDKDIALFLLQHGAYPNVTDKLGMSPLLYAVEKNQTELAKVLLQFHADPNMAEKAQGLTPLLACVINKNHDLAKVLLGFHADPKVTMRKDGVTAFSMARDQKDEKMIAVLNGQ